MRGMLFGGRWSVQPYRGLCNCAVHVLAQAKNFAPNFGELRTEHVALPGRLMPEFYRCELLCAAGHELADHPRLPRCEDQNRVTDLEHCRTVWA